MISVEAILMIRVYALYNRNRWIARGFATLILAEIATVAVGLALNGSPFDYVEESLFMTAPDAFIYFAISSVVTQCIIISLTLVKSFLVSRLGLGREPIIILMVRDGTVAFLLLLILSVLTGVYTIRDNPLATILAFWFLTTLQSSGCRLIINMQRCPVGTSAVTHMSSVIGL